MKRIRLLMIALVSLLVLANAPHTVAAARDAFPDKISLPDGFQPEGIVVGRGTTIYSGSVATGAIYSADLRTGQGSILVPPQSGRAAVGLGFDSRTNFLYVSGGPTGSAYVYDAATGAEQGVYQLTSSTATFINDAVVTRDAVYFTESLRPVLYRLPLSAGGALPAPSAVQEIPLSGDYQFEPNQFNANGIEATPDGRWLIIVNTTVGALYRVNPTTGEATEIDLGGGSVANGDGLLLRGHTLYVVQNFLNQVAVVKLNNKFTSGEIVQVLTDPRFDIPTTIATHGNRLYVVNARFSTPPTPATQYDILMLP